MNITVLTLFPDQIQACANTSIIGRAINAGILSVKTKNIRDHARNAYAKVDDYMFGGGTGMLMLCDPVYDSWKSIIDEMKPDMKHHTIFLSPKGKVFSQKKAIELSKMDNLILLCGHYEGIDQRVLDEIVDEEISIGDYVLTGGELAASVVIDAVARLVEGVLPNEEAFTIESHMGGTLEHPQYTRPAIWHEKKVPDVLLSGHHQKITKWKKLESYRVTMEKRPDLFAKLNLTEKEILEIIEHEKL